MTSRPASTASSTAASSRAPNLSRGSRRSRGTSFAANLPFHLIDVLAAILFLAIWSVGFLSFGGVTERAESVMSILAIIFGGLICLRSVAAILMRRYPLRFVRLPLLPVVCWGLFLLWGALALMPLGSNTLANLSPAASDYYQDFSPLLGMEPRLSLDPGATARALSRLLILTIFGLSVAQWAQSRQRRNGLLGGLLGVAVIAAIYAYLELGGLVGDTRGWTVATGPFINRNHFAALLAMVIPIACALAYSYIEQRSERHLRRGGELSLLVILRSRYSLVLFLPLAIIATCLATLSRGGIAAALLGMLVWVAAESRGVGGRVRAIRAGGVLISGAALLLLATGLDPLQQRLGELPRALDIEDPYSRAQLWRSTWEMASDFPLTGAGLGSYYGVYLPYALAPTNYLPVHAHSDWLQVLAETGVVGFALILIGLAALAFAMWRNLGQLKSRRDRHLLAGLAGGIAAILLQSAGEFALRIPWIGFQMALMLGLVIALIGKSPQEGLAAAHPASHQG